MTKREVSNNEIMEALNGFTNDVNKRFDDVDKRFFKIEQDIAGLKTEIIDLKKSHNQLMNTIDRFIARIDHYEVEQMARDRQLERLLDWARKVSEKTGIPLENL